MAYSPQNSKPITADSLDGRLLLALRAGPNTREQLKERDYMLPSRIAELKRRGLLAEGTVLKSGEVYLTDKGRAACPLRRKSPDGETELSGERLLNKQAEHQRRKGERRVERQIGR